MTQLALSFTAVQKTPRSTKMGLSYRQLGLQAATLDGKWKESSQDLKDWDLEKGLAVDS